MKEVSLDDSERALRHVEEACGRYGSLRAQLDTALTVRRGVGRPTTDLDDLATRLSAITDQVSWLRRLLSEGNPSVASTALDALAGDLGAWLDELPASRTDSKSDRPLLDDIATLRRSLED